MRKNIFCYPIDIAIGKAIRELRNSKGYTMRELASKGGVPHSYIGKIENYKRRLTFGEIEEVANWMEIKSEDIIMKAKEISIHV